MLFRRTPQLAPHLSGVESSSDDFLTAIVTLCAIHETRKSHMSLYDRVAVLMFDPNYRLT